MTRSRNASSRWFLALFMVVGLLAIGLGATVIRESTTTPAGWITVTGTVVDRDESIGTDGTTYNPIVEYVVDGVPYRVRSSIGGTAMPTIGEAMDVAYDPADPADARVTGGMIAFAWLMSVGVGVLFVVLAGAALLMSAPGRVSRGPAHGDVPADPATGRSVYRAARGSRPVGVLLGFVGALVFAGLAVWLVAGGGIGMLIALLPAFFAALLLVSSIAQVRRGFDARLIEVGPAGIWLPELGERRWDEIADVRVEEWTAPAGGRSYGAEIRVATYRRLGIVPSDPALAARRGLATRLATGMAGGFNGLLALGVGREAVDQAPFGVAEPELGSEAFEALVDEVRRYRPVEVHEEPQTPTESPLERFVRREG